MVSSWNLQIFIKFRIFFLLRVMCSACVCVRERWVWMSFSAVLLCCGETPPTITVGVLRHPGYRNCFFSCCCLSYKPLCLVTLDSPQSLYILTDLKGFKASRLIQTPPTCPPPSPQKLPMRKQWTQLRCFSVLHKCGCNPRGLMIAPNLQLVKAPKVKKKSYFNAVLLERSYTIKYLRHDFVESEWFIVMSLMHHPLTQSTPRKGSRAHFL